jgi:uncharacterized protein (DUF736 family)
MSKATTTTIDTIGVFKSAAAAIYSGTMALSIVNAQVETLRKGKIVFGKSVKSCTYRVQLGDAMQAAFVGKAAKTYSNYVTAFIAAVNEGTEFSFSHSKGKAAPGKGKGKGAKGKIAFSDLFAKPFNHDSGKSFKDLCAKVESEFNDAKHPTIYAAFADYLKEKGFVITE